MRSARFGQLDVTTLYALLKLRTDVFVVEQRCPYPELDGRDAEPETVHAWVEHGGAPVAYLRLLADPSSGGVRIGRVVTAPAFRSQGQARSLMTWAMETAGRPLVLSAQTYLAGWYEQFGFRISGPAYDDEGIEHVPMRLD